MLLSLLKQGLTKLQNKEHMPVQSMIQSLTEAIDFIEKSNSNPQFTEVLDAVDKLTAKVGRNHEKIEENTTITRTLVKEISSSLSSSPSSSKLSTSSSSTRSWAAVAAVPRPKPTINKDTEIVVRLNDSEKKQVLQKTDQQAIVEEINRCIAHHEISSTSIRAIKKLQSGDIAVHTINEEEAEKLRTNTAWTQVLGQKAKTSLQTWGVMVEGVEIADFDLKTPESREAAITKITDQNKNMEVFQGMEIVWIGWRSRITADQKVACMVLEVTTPESGNAIIDYNLMVGRQVRVCTVFNKMCKTIQCFRCYHYGHTTIQCTRQERCGHCGGQHATNSKQCAENAKSSCCLCGGGHKPWMKSCPEKQKEIRRIIYQKSITPSRFPTKNDVKAASRPYFTEETSFLPSLMDTDGTSFPKATREFGENIKKARTTRSNESNYGGSPVPDFTPRSTRSNNNNKNRGRGRGEATARSRSPAKGRATGTRLRDEAEKGGDYMPPTAANRTALSERNANKENLPPPSTC